MDVVTLANRYNMVDDVRNSVTNPARVRATIRRLLDRAANDTTFSPQDREVWRYMADAIRKAPTPDLAIDIANHINRATRTF